MGNCVSDPKYRIAECDIIRGILIVFVVIGHSGEGVLHDIIFLFHMPLFFVLSGFLLEGDRAKEKEYLTYKAKRLLIPYVGYLLVDFLLVRRDYSMNSLIHAFYGGRACSGVYWYITCFLFTLAMHMPLNHWQNTIGYGKLIYTIIGVGNLILVVIFCGGIL